MDWKLRAYLKSQFTPAGDSVSELRRHWGDQFYIRVSKARKILRSYFLSEEIVRARRDLTPGELLEVLYLVHLWEFGTKSEKEKRYERCFYLRGLSTRKGRCDNELGRAVSCRRNRQRLKDLAWRKACGQDLNDRFDFDLEWWETKRVRIVPTLKERLRAKYVHIAQAYLEDRKATKLLGPSAGSLARKVHLLKNEVKKHEKSRRI